MNFNDWDDDDDFGNDKPNDYFQQIRQTEKEILKIDLNRGMTMPMSLSEWREIFGEPTNEDLHDITQAYIKQYHHYGDEYISSLVDAFDVKWIRYLLSYNEEVEEYELCALIKEHLDIHHKEIS